MATTNETVKALVAVGGARWQKGAMDRVYFNNLSEWYGLKTSRYNTGNISSATLDGKGISNGLAREIDITMSTGKVWFDVPTGKWWRQGIDQPALSKIVAAIEAKMAALPVA